MAGEPKPEPSAARQDEERLAHALISRGLVTRDEVQACKPGRSGPYGPEALLRRLVRAGHLTAGQAERARQELEALLTQRIPGFQLLEKLGQGSMGVVYKARQLSMNRLVAVKILHARLSTDAGFLAALKREAHLAARLSHNHIVQAIDVGQAGPLHYFVMELVEGRTIREELDAGKVFGEAEAVTIILQVARALEHAAGRGLVHRDVKPANIVLTKEGVAKLADLGMARDTEDSVRARKERGIMMGTPYYIAPEQIRGRVNIDVRADLYALGATLYHMVTGRPPFPYRDVEAVLKAHLKEEVTPPDHLNPALSSGLGEVVETLLAKDRRARYRNAGELALDLESLLRGEPPRLARPKLESDTLRALAEGDEDEDEADEAERGDPGLVRRLWLGVAVLGGLLFLSVLGNLLLLLRRGH
jgi:serine/threonine-protein kinase